jgi:hypothetical protein
MGVIKDSLRLKKAGKHPAGSVMHHTALVFSDFFIQHVTVVRLLIRWHLNFFIISSLKRKSKTEDCFIQFAALVGLVLHIYSKSCTQEDLLLIH